VVVTLVGLPLLTQLSSAGARQIIAMLITATVIALGRGMRLPTRPPTRIVALVCRIGGVMNNVAAISVPPVVAYPMALPHAAHVLRAATLVFFTFTALVAIVPLRFAGLIDQQAMSSPILDC